MKAVNLIPAPKLAAKRWRMHVRRCAAGCAVWALLAASAGGMAFALGEPVDATLDARIVAADQEIQRTEGTIAATKADLLVVESALNANRAIADQPDWSLLLALLASKTGDDVVLKSCHVYGPDASGEPPSARSQPRQPGEAPGFVVGATGLARSQLSVTQFVLRLEDTHLFGRVTLVDTSIESFLGGEAVGFRLECSLEPPEPEGVKK